MNEVGICVIVRNNFHETKYFVENLLKTTSKKYRLYVFDYGSNDEQTANYCKEICETHKGYFKAFGSELSIAEIYNKFLEIVAEQFFCFVPVNAIVPNGWLDELMSHYKAIENSGCLGIKTNEDNLFLTGALHHAPDKLEDEIKTVWSNKTQTIEGVLFFNRDQLSVVGRFDTASKAFGFECAEFSFRFTFNGFKNYYIKRCSYIKIKIIDPILFPLKTKSAAQEFRTQLETMLKVRQFKK